MEYLELENEIKNSVELLKAYYIQLYRELNKLEDKPMENIQNETEKNDVKQRNICMYMHIHSKKFIVCVS